MIILDLVGRGRAAVADGDSTAWHRLLAQLSRSADRDIRLAGALALGEILLEEAPRRARRSAALHTAETVLADLEADALEPARWALLARLLAALGQVKAAAACDAAARRLEPDHAQNLGSAAPFAAARALAAEAAALAATVRPPDAMGRLSVVMIVRDEATMLPDCLRSVADVADEVVIVDTGSRDSTVEVAEAFGARVIHRLWDGSFAAARNASLEPATGDWVLWLDADERLLPDDVPALRRLLAKPWRAAAYVHMIHATRREGVGLDVSSSLLRLWRRVPGVHFEGIVHEQVAGLPRFLPARFESASVRVLHEGYRDDVVQRKDKYNRNRTLLERQIAESDGAEQAFSWFNLGVEHLVRGNAADALPALEHALEALRREGGIAAAAWGPTLALRLTAARRIAGDAGQAEREAADWLETFPEHTDLAIERAQCAMLADPARALELLEEAIRRGDGPVRYNSIVGAATYVGAALRGDFLARLGRHRDAAGSYRDGLAQNPDYVAGIGGMARSLLLDGTPPADVLEELGPFAWRYIDAAGGLLGTALLSADAIDEARAVFAELQARRPDLLEARVGLASCALSQGDTATARALCEPLPAGTGEAETLVRCAVFSALLDEDPADALAILSDPAARTLPRGQAEAFAAWQKLLAGHPVVPLEADAARAALEFLGAAIKLERLEACDVLHRLVATSRLPFAEARDALAQRFLDAGFTDVAADEWLAMLEREGPSGNGLLGLARVALARDAHEDAMALAEEAGRLDPALAASAERVRLLADASGALTAFG